MRGLKDVLRVGGSVVALMATAAVASPALAQTTDTPATDAPVTNAPVTNAPAMIAPAVEEADQVAQEEDVSSPEIVVTGTSFRGVPPVGSNLVSVGRDAIEDTGAQTMQQVLKTVPQITAAGNAGQGPAGTSYYSPTIHSLGSSASNSTLVLIDGHRFSLGGQPHPLSDPNIIPPIALQRVEVLAEGASSIYGSDAVAGVINFITRSGYDGTQVTFQRGFGQDYDTFNGAALWGTAWDDGSIMLAYAHSYRSALANDARDFLNPDKRPQGGTSFLSFNCSPATVQPGGAGNIYLNPTSDENVPNSTNNAVCDNSRYSDLLPEEVRDNFFGKLELTHIANLTLGVDFAYSDRRNHSRAARGTLTATAFRAGDQANPFYVNPPGVAPDTPAGDRQTIRWSADELLGPGAYNDNSSINYYLSPNFDYEINEDWTVRGLALWGRETHHTESNGQLCGSCANLALNGTTNTAGNPLQPSIPGTTVFVTNLPLTADNALDVWNPAATNLTSAEVLAQLTDSLNVANYYHEITQFRASVDGSLFTLPGGDVRLALGAEYLEYGLEIQRSRPNNTGPAAQGSEQLDLDLGRDVQSYFAELLVPIFGPDNAIPFARRVDITASVRHDSYSDVGDTTNPKYGFNWEVAQGLQFRGNWSQSFVAPAISSMGDASRQGLASFSGYGLMSGAVIIPIANYPLAAQLPGCDAPGQVTCTIGTSTVQGISYNNGNPDLEPQTGEGWSVGFDFAPEFAPGLRVSATLFNASFRGGVTSPNLATVINTPGLNHLLTIYPDGATPEEVSAIVGQAPLNSPLPATIYFIRNGQQQNVVNLDIRGLDINAGYEIETETAGTFRIDLAVSRFLEFNQNIGGGPWFSVLNTTGFNETFPSVELQARLNLGWDIGPFSADVFVNHIGEYSNWSSTTVTPLTRDANGNPNGGGDPVDATWLYDLNLAYELRGFSVMRDAEIYLDVVNLFDEDPPFYNNANGYDNYSGNPLGRVVSIGARVNF